MWFIWLLFFIVVGGLGAVVFETIENMLIGWLSRDRS